MSAMSLAATPGRAQSISFSTVATDAYSAGDVNSCAIALNNLTTVGGFQFVGYYDTAGRLMVGRRSLGSASWQSFDSGLAVPKTDLAGDHNVIALAVDSAGLLHASWDMHNQSLKYATSNNTVLGGSLGSISFTTQTAANAPTLFPDSGTTTNSVTYPQFYNIPGSANLLLTYRNGGAGGGSGNGDQYFNVYDPATHAWTNRRVINGEATSVNAYLNSLVYTSTDNLLMSWTWRTTSNWQTNSNIMYGQSPDHGTTWFRQGGVTQYSLPIIQSGTPATSVAQVIKTIAPNSSFINQTSMTVDAADNPLVGTWWAPGWNPSTNSGNPNRQYMLVYFDGSAWRTSQVSSRSSDTAIDTSGSFVRDLGRPIVLTDDQDRVLIMTRSENTAMGAYANAATPNNGLVVYYSTMTSLQSATPAPWRSVTLDTLNMGAWEPTCDAALWRAERKLSLFYEPTGVSSANGTLRIMDWDEPAFFAEFSKSYWNLSAGGDWDAGANWTNSVPNAIASVPTFGGGPVTARGDTTITLTGTKTVGAMTFDNARFQFSLVSGTSGALNLNNGIGIPASVAVKNGHHTIAAPVTLSPAGAVIETAAATSLVISRPVSGSGAVAKTGGGTLTMSGSNTYTGVTTVAGGTLVLARSAWNPVLTGAGGADLQRGRVVFDYAGGASPAGTIDSILSAGRSTNFSSGRIRSSQLSATTTLGWRDDSGSSDVIVGQVLYGDANLDGTVDLTDFTFLASSFNGTGTNWATGDFNYDDRTDLTDFTYVASDFNQRLPTTGEAAPAGVGGLLPEPSASSFLLGIGTIVLAGRRRWPLADVAADVPCLCP